MYYRNCPDCLKEIEYTQLVNYKKSFIKNKLCQHCAVKKSSKVIYTMDKCEEIALLFNTRYELKSKYPGVYNKCYKNKWYHLFSHMSYVGNVYKRCIYSYEFPNNFIYIGLTFNLDKRSYSHTIDPLSSVYRHTKLTGNIPILNKLTDYIDSNQASIKEKEFINEYKNKGYSLLNRISGGNLGSSYTKWDRDSCLHSILLCNSRKEFIVKYPGAYYSCVKNGWNTDIKDNIKSKVKERGHWTKELCKQEALKFSTKKEFKNKCISAYNICNRNGWMLDVCKHMDKLRKERDKGYWTKEKCSIVSLNYKNRTLFRKDYPGAYKACYKNNWLDDIFKMD